MKFWSNHRGNYQCWMRCAPSTYLSFTVARNTSLLTLWDKLNIKSQGYFKEKKCQTIFANYCHVDGATRKAMEYKFESRKYVFKSFLYRRRRWNRIIWSLLFERTGVVWWKISDYKRKGLKLLMYEVFYRGVYKIKHFACDRDFSL